MSALLAAASASFTYQGASISLSAGSASELIEALAAFGIKTQTAAANDTGAPGKSKPTPTPAPAAATAPAGSPATQTTASSAPAAEAAAAGDQGNAGTTSGTAGAQTASSSAAAESPAVTFDELKKAFLALSTKADGRAKCEAVLHPFKLAKLSEAKPEQYAAVLAAITKASA